MGMDVAGRNTPLRPFDMARNSGAASPRRAICGLPWTLTMRSEATSLPARAEFLKLARTHTLVPLYRTLTADVETPVTAFLRLASDEPECFMLESVEQGDKIGRYTFIGIRPFRKMTSHGRTIEITENG